MTLIDHPLGETTISSEPYVAPRLELSVCPRVLNTYDGFVVSGRAFGTQVEGATVEVSVDGVVRTAPVHDGEWVVRFEDGSMRTRHAGVRAVTGRITDSWFNTAQATEWVMIDQFVDGYVYVDGRHDVEGGFGPGGVLVASGELGLGTHDQGRELVVMLVRDDEEGVVVSVGAVEPGWHHGEWFARIPLDGVTEGGYRVRALLTDTAGPNLTRLAAGLPFRLP